MAPPKIKVKQGPLTEKDFESLFKMIAMAKAENLSDDEVYANVGKVGFTPERLEFVSGIVYYGLQIVENPEAKQEILSEAKLWNLAPTDADQMLVQKHSAKLRELLSEE
jgi:hypothetical protein